MSGNTIKTAGKYLAIFALIIGIICIVIIIAMLASNTYTGDTDEGLAAFALLMIAGAGVTISFIVGIIGILIFASGEKIERTQKKRREQLTLNTNQPGSQAS